jgi:hypothetical protein
MQLQEWIKAPLSSPIPSIDREEWAKWGRSVGASMNTLKWKMARWGIAGEEVYNVTIREMSKIAMVSEAQLCKCMWAGKVGIALIAEFPELAGTPFAAFESVARGSIPKEVKVHALKERMRKRLSVREMEVLLKEWRQPNARWDDREDQYVEILLSREIWDKLTAVAKDYEYASPENYLISTINQEWKRLFGTHETPLPEPERIVIPEGQKQCSKCRDIKSIEEFHRHPSCAGGRNSQCKACFYQSKERLKQSRMMAIR